jgi:predicted nuclease with TOPRIM domain
MGLDSTANLLFTIGADSSDAQSNIQRFRGLLSKDLSGMKGEFDDWAKKVFGSFSSFKSMAIGATAAAAAGAVALGYALVKAAGHAAQFADEIEDGTDKTGLSAQEMSKLRYAAEATGLSYESLVGNLVKFQRRVVEAASGNQQAQQSFQRLGISQGEVKQGLDNILPLFLRTADGVKSLQSTVIRTATEIDLFGRSGAGMAEMMMLGADGIKLLMDRAESLGRVLDEKALESMKRLRIETKELDAQLEAIKISMGKVVVESALGWQMMITSTIQAAKNATDPVQFFSQWRIEARKTAEAMQAVITAGMLSGHRTPELAEPVSAAAKKNYEGLTELLEKVRGGFARLGTEEEEARFKISTFWKESGKAAEKLEELRKEGAITGAAFQREMAAIARLPQAIGEFAQRQGADIIAARNMRIEEAAIELRSKLASYDQQTYQDRVAYHEAEVASMRQKLNLGGKLSDENRKLLDQIEKAGIRRIEGEQMDAYLRNLIGLRQNLDQQLAVRASSRGRLALTYKQEQDQFSYAEEAKTREVAEDEEQRYQIHADFMQLRTISFANYTADLQVLRNSEGWQGVFGEQFGAAIRGNEELLRLWAESANQSLLMVAVAMEGTAQTFQRGFQNFSRAMGANIAQAIVYEQSIGEAMRAAAASAIQAIAAESLVNAIYSTGLGFLALARHDYPGAAAAFQAAAIFGSVGVVAAVAGRAIAPPQAGAGGRGAGSEGSGAGAAGSDASEAQKRAAPMVAIYISGPIVGPSGIEELTDMINEAVQGRDVRLVATEVKRVGRTLR